MNRSAYVVTTSLAVLTLGALSVIPTPPKLIWNASASAPIGLYSVHPIQQLKDGDFVAVDPPGPLSQFLAARGYLPVGVPLLKHVVARSGQTVCRAGVVITVDGAAIGVALAQDRTGRSLPVWQGCRRVAAGQVFLMNRRVSDSFDGRYFGLLPTNSIVGRAVPLWTDEHGSGRFTWRAVPR